MKKLSEKYYILLLLIALFIIFAILSYLSNGTYGGADDIVHYRFARYSFSHPEFFLNHWAKPVFTLLSSPFAQFGFFGIKIFNLIIGSLTAYFSYKTVKILNYKNAFLVIIFIFFSPIYTMLLLSGMTEILFSFTLILAIYLFFKDKYILSSIIISFLPFVRTEGIVILPIFALAYLLNKKNKAIVFVLTGFVFYSIIGSFYYHDLFWVINKMPYTGAKNIYGSGSLFHFINQTKYIEGIPLAIFLVIGIIYSFIKTPFTKNKILINKEFNVLLIIFLPMIAYFFAHSFAWWLGVGSSLGLIRVMTGIIPLFAIYSLKGFNLTYKFLSFNKWVKLSYLLIIAFIVIRTPFEVFKIPVELNQDKKLVKEASEWIKKSDYYNDKIFYYDPFFYFFLNINPYDKNRIQELIPNRNKPEQGIPLNSLVLWDAHFSPNEGQLPLKRLLNNPNFKLLKKFTPKNNFKVLGGYDYEIYIFQRENPNATY